MPAGHLEEGDYVAVKTRPATPEGSGTGGFWLAAVSAASGAPHGSLPLEGCNETGFINSQPSMAEFMTALPHLSGDMSHGPSMSPQHTPPSGGYPMEVPHSLGSPSVNVPEYPWMKEKKTTRKNSQQGKEIYLMLSRRGIYITVLSHLIAYGFPYFYPNLEFSCIFQHILSASS